MAVSIVFFSPKFCSICRLAEFGRTYFNPCVKSCCNLAHRQNSHLGDPGSNVMGWKEQKAWPHTREVRTVQTADRALPSFAQLATAFSHICWHKLTNGNLWKISLSRLCKTSLLCQVQSEEYNVFCGQEDVFRWFIPDQSCCYLSPDATDTRRFGTQSGLLVGGNVMQVSRSEVMRFVMICARTIKDYHRISEADSSIGKLR